MWALFCRGCVHSCTHRSTHRGAQSPVQLQYWHRSTARWLRGRSLAVLSCGSARGLGFVPCSRHGSCSACKSQKKTLSFCSVRQTSGPVSQQHPVSKCKTAYACVFIGNFAVLYTPCVTVSVVNKKHYCFECCQDFHCFSWASNEKGEANSWIVRPGNL